MKSFGQVLRQNDDGKVVQAYPIVADVQSCVVREEPVNEAGLRNFLMGHSWPNGLQENLVKCTRKMPIRYIICDDSGSMAQSDGNKIVKGSVSGKDRFVERSITLKKTTI